MKNFCFLLVLLIAVFPMRLLAETTQLEKLDDLINERARVLNLPLIPNWLREMKLKKIDEKIATLKKSQGKYKSVKITHIKIDAWGDWDEFAGPEIMVKTGAWMITNGLNNDYHLDKVLSEDVTDFDLLTVYDDDATTQDYMGIIDLDKQGIRNGLTGDSYTRTITGKVSVDDEKKGFEYKVEYLVEY